METVRWEWEWLWTTWQIVYEGSDREHESNIIDMIEQFDDDYSRFKETSLLSVFNQTKTILNPTKEFSGLLDIWLEAHTKTDGFFSPFVWVVLERLGYDKDYSFQYNWTGYVPYEEMLTQTGDTFTLWSNSSFDLGWYGKWFLVDKISWYLLSHWIDTRMISWGWDIRIQQDDASLLWKIALVHPLKKDIFFWEIVLEKWAITCSSWLERQWWHNHHLINPRNQQPSKSDIVAVYAYHKTACWADIASTTLFVCWVEHIESYAQKLGVAYLVLFDDDSYLHSVDFPRFHFAAQ